MTQGLVGFLLFLGAGWGCGSGASPAFRCVLFCLQIMMKIKILRSIITKVLYASVESLSDVELVSLQ